MHVAKIQHSVTINQPVEQVFAFITDTRNTTRWQPLISEARATLEGPAQIGTQVTEVRTFIGRKMEATYEIVELEPNKRIVLKSVGGPFPYKGTITFESLGNATKVTFDAETEVRGFFKLADGVIAGSMRKSLETNLSTAKQVVEAGG
jgi:uncharacterized protein YndB with AHSA1/START domain